MYDPLKYKGNESVNCLYLISLTAIRKFTYSDTYDTHAHLFIFSWYVHLWELFFIEKSKKNNNSARGAMDLTARPGPLFIKQTPPYDGYRNPHYKPVTTVRGL